MVRRLKTHLAFYLAKPVVYGQCFGRYFLLLLAKSKFVGRQNLHRPLSSARQVVDAFFFLTRLMVSPSPLLVDNNLFFSLMGKQGWEGGGSACSLNIISSLTHALARSPTRLAWYEPLIR